MTETIIFTSAYILDLIIGDPRWLPHPVKFMGWGIDKMEKILKGKNIKNVIPAKAGIQKNGLDSPVKPWNDDFMCKEAIMQFKDKLTGIILVIIIVVSTYSIFYILNKLLLLTPYSLLPLLLLVFFTSTTLATKDLITSGKGVIAAVTAGNTEEARRKLSMIVGRDTKQLDSKGISKATIETLAENASDGIMAPMFYFAIGGLPLAMAYKAVNTLDSMVGYKNEQYKNFGWAAAKLDDIVNYIPARITGVLIAVSSFILNLSLATCNSSLKIMLRDGRKHLSPNSGIPEAAMAGALGVRLGGASTYGGIVVEKPYIGEDVSGVRSQESGVNEVYYNASEKALTIIKVTSLLGFGLTLILLYLRTGL